MFQSWREKQFPVATISPLLVKIMFLQDLFLRTGSFWRHRTVHVFFRYWLKELSKGHTAWDSLSYGNDFSRAVIFLLSFHWVVVFDDEAGTLIVEQLHKWRQSGQHSHRADWEIPASPIPSSRNKRNVITLVELIRHKEFVQGSASPTG